MFGIFLKLAQEPPWGQPQQPELWVQGATTLRLDLPAESEGGAEDTRSARRRSDAIGNSYPRWRYPGAPVVL